MKVKLKYTFKPGDVLTYLPTKTPYIVIRVFDNYSIEDYKMALQNGVPGVPKIGNQNVRFIHVRDVFTTYEPKDETIKLLYAEEQN